MTFAAEQTMLKNGHQQKLFVCLVALLSNHAANAADSDSNPMKVKAPFRIEEGYLRRPEPVKGTREWVQSIFLENWPSPLERIGITTSDLPSSTDKTIEEFAKGRLYVGLKEIPDSEIAGKLRKTPIVFLANARQKHATACLLFLKKQYQNSITICDEANELYAEGFIQARRGNRSNELEDFFVTEKQKVANLLTNSQLAIQRSKQKK